MIFVPLFRDTSYVGRALSILFRISRVMAGIFAILASLGVIALIFAIWLVLPFLLIIYGRWFGMITVLLAWAGYTVSIASQPHHDITGRDDLDTLDRVATQNAKRVLAAPGNAEDYINRLVGFTHTKAIIAKMGIELDTFKDEIYKRAGHHTDTIPIDRSFKKSLEVARRLGHKHVTLADVFLGLVESVPYVRDALFECGLTAEETQTVIIWMDRQWQLEHPPRFWDPDFTVKRLGGVNRAWTARPTPTLNTYGIDVTRQAQLGKTPKLIGREKVVDEIVQILSRSSRDNVLIVGPAGAGKSTLVSGLAGWIIEGDVDPVLFSKRIVRLDVPQLIAGAEAQGEVERRIIEIMKEVKEAGNVIVFLDQIHTLAGAGSGTESLNVFAAFEPFLSDTETQIIGATSWLNYRSYLEPNEAFARMFQLVELPEADEKETQRILEVTTSQLEQKLHITVSYKALRAAYTLSEKYIHDRVQPDKSLDLLEEAAALISRSPDRSGVTEKDIAAVVAQKTEIPVQEVTAEESKKLLHLEEQLHKRVIGQDQAINAIADALRRARVGLREEDRPIGTLLFVGPTGVGKTELAKALSEAYFGSENAMIRLDMSEFQTQDSVSSLIGPPPSASGTPVPGRLTEAVRRRPFSLILLDELEKAHPEILNLFLQVFEDGRLTDGSGRTVKFNNSIIIATSNAGTRIFLKAIRENWDGIKTKQTIQDEIHKFFRPEFLNRFDGIIVFTSLTRDQLHKIVRLKLNQIKKQMEAKDITLQFSDQLVAELAERGYDPMMGARPLRRLIQDTVESYLARLMLENRIERGDVVRLGPEILG